MSRNKAFSFDVPDAAPWTFEINGATVEVVGSVDGLKLLTFMGIMGSDRVSDHERAAAIVDWLKQCFAGETSGSEAIRAELQAKIDAGEEGIRLPAPVMRWDAFLEVVDANKIDIERLGEIAGWLADELSENPTQAQPSANGQSPTGPSSAAVSSLPTSTGAASTPAT